MHSRCILVTALVLGCAGLGGCAARRPPSSSPPTELIPAISAPDQSPAVAPGPGSPIEAPVAGSLRPSTATGAVPLELADSRLAAALAHLEAEPTAARARAVAAEYLRLGVVDAAVAHLTAAVTRNPHDGAAYDERARLWRDAGLLSLAFADAHRAVFFAPGAAAPQNTLGTLFQALGDRRTARMHYLRALSLEPTAGYVWNNLCYLSFLDAQFERAIEECRAAVHLDENLTAARNNGALAQAAAGRPEQAEATLAGLGGAVAHYNIGLLRLARHDFAAAAESFDAACAGSGPLLDARARARARQARRLQARSRN